MDALKESTIALQIRESAEQFGSRTAVSYKGQRWTYQELDSVTDILAAGLLAAGVRKETHVAILAENSAHYVLAFYAALKIGCLVSLINPGLKAGELGTIFDTSDITHVILGERFKEQKLFPVFQEIQSKHPVSLLWEIGDEQANSEQSWKSWILTGTIWLQKHGINQLEQVKASVKPEDPGLMIYTSGTTGKIPKAVLSNQFHLVNGGLLKAYAQRMNEQDVVCCALQMFHIFCVDVDILAALVSGAELAIPDAFHSEDFLHTVENRKCTLLSAVPRIYEVLIEKPFFNSYDISSLRAGIIGGAYCPPALFERIEQALHFVLLPGLGQSEITAGIATGDLEDDLRTRSTTVGKPNPFAVVEIRDAGSKNSLEQGLLGEICVKSPMVMLGYYNNEAMTKETVDEDGWLHTGDLGYFDSAGYLHVSGKLKNVINRAGEKVLPEEVEEALMKLGGMEECSVIGLPDPDYGEDVCACIIRKPGSSISTAEIKNRLSDQLARYKVPRFLYYTDDFPRTATGKVIKKTLIQEVLQNKEKLER